MSKSLLTEDTVKFIMEADASMLQQEIHETNKTLKDLKTERKKLLEQEAALNRAHLSFKRPFFEAFKTIK